MGCNYGLSCLDPETGGIINFIENDGLISAKFYLYFALNNGSVKDSKGNLYFGTSRGVIYFNPDEVLEDLKSCESNWRFTLSASPILLPTHKAVPK